MRITVLLFSQVEFFSQNKLVLLPIIITPLDQSFLFSSFLLFLSSSPFGSFQYNTVMADSSAAPSPPLRASEPKVPFPEKFDGDRRKYRGFINQLELVFMLNPSKYSSEATKVAVIGTLLTGKALAWFTPFLEHMDKHQDLLNNYGSFRQLLQETFDEHDRSLLAATRIRKLRQGSQSVSSYASEFRRLASDLEWNDSALIHQFRSGLNDEVKDMLLHHPYPTSLAEAVSLAIGVGNRLFEHRQEMSQHSSDTRPVPRRPRFGQRMSFQTLPPAARPAPPVVDSFGPAPMDIGIMRGGPLPNAERQRRIKNGLCRYCGSQDHQLASCPVAPRKPKTEVNSASTVPGKEHRQ